jgi:hypothetical protein
MLAYVFWHAPAEGVDAAPYEHALIAFHRSLAHSPPFGFEGSAAFRIAEPPWSATGEPLEPSDAAAGAMPGAPAPSAAGAWYEDWYLVEDFAALGVLNESAVARGHRTSHDRAAKGLGRATAGVYRVIEGELSTPSALAECTHATWVTPAAGAGSAELGAMLGDGADPRGSSVWQRQLVLGPAPEFCVLSREPLAGVAPTRLAPGWSARTLAREPVFGG